MHCDICTQPNAYRSMKDGKRTYTLCPSCYKAGSLFKLAGLEEGHLRGMEIGKTLGRADLLSKWPRRSRA